MNMRIIYKKTLSIIAFLIAICGFMGIAYLFYDKVLNDETSVVVVDELSINYIDGISITKDGSYNFSITNSSDKDVYYEINYNELKGYNKELKYNLVSTDASVNIENSSLDKDSNVLASNILIKAGITQNFTITIKGSDNTSFKLKIKRAVESDKYFYMNILANNEIKDKPITEVGKSIATTNEGLIEDIDDTGITYYFRGNISNNYVDFAGLTWRIVRINGNGTVKLVLDKLSTDLSNYNINANNYENYDKSSINNSLKSFYDTNLKSNDSLISNSKFCIETGNITRDNNKIYNSYTRIITDKIPTLNCLGNGYSSKIGLLTIDEVIYAGANPASENKSYYLYSENVNNLWWTSSLATSKNGDFYPIAIDSNGKIVTNISGKLYRGLRPTINLIKKVKSEGKGTKEEPYKIIQ